jgi:hypothetical protein
MYLLLFLGFMALYGLLAKPLSEICRDVRIPVSACGDGTWTLHEGFRRLHQLHHATKVLLFLVWLFTAILADKQSRRSVSIV